MNDTDLILDDKSLEEAEKAIRDYVAKQIECLNDFLLEIKRLADEWDNCDYEEVLNTASALSRKADLELHDEEKRRSAFLREHQAHFAARPKFGVAAKASGASFSAPNSKKRELSSTYERIFEKCEEKIKIEMLRNLGELRLYDSRNNGNETFYDPDGLSRMRLMKNIVNIDMNSPDYERELGRMVGLHAYFKHRDDERLAMMRIYLKERDALLGKEGASNLNKAIDETPINAKYLKFKDKNELSSLRFYSYCFDDYIHKRNDSRIKEAYPDSYAYFLKMIEFWG